MKYLFIVSAVAGLLWACNASDSKSVTSAAATADPLTDSANYTSIKWMDSTSQELGKVKQGQIAEISWHFKNSGDKPLVIQSVRPGCGCTVADQPNEPILPRKEGFIKAKFDSNGQHEGAHTKNVYVYANTAGNTIHELQFRVEVVK